MKLFDCTLYYDEDLILETRLNILDKYFDKFIICEAKYTHSGREKKLNFDINKFSKFKDKIIYLVVEKEPENLIYEDKENKIELDSDLRTNSARRIAFQRNKLLEAVKSVAEPNDYIFYSDNDEIPYLSLFDPKKNKNKIVIFEQELFYFKFNLLCNRIKWYGTRAIKKRDLIMKEVLNYRIAYMKAISMAWSDESFKDKFLNSENVLDFLSS